MGQQVHFLTSDMAVVMIVQPCGFDLRHLTCGDSHGHANVGMPEWK